MAMLKNHGYLTQGEARHFSPRAHLQRARVVPGPTTPISVPHRRKKSSGFGTYLVKTFNCRWDSPSLRPAGHRSTLSFLPRSLQLNPEYAALSQGRLDADVTAETLGGFLGNR